MTITVPVKLKLEKKRKRRTKKNVEDKRKRKLQNTKKGLEMAIKYNSIECFRWHLLL